LEANTKQIFPENGPDVQTLLNVENLSIGYGATPIAQNINFAVREGDYICIVGENGAGKSTLVKTILGLNKAISGNIRFGTGVIDKIAYLPQQTVIQNDFPATVFEVVLSGRQKRGLHKLFYNAADKQAARDALKRFEISHLEKKSVKELPGGQKQRVLLARALCDEKDILFLDEPVAGLDPNITEDLYCLLADINKSGTSIVMISHDMSGVHENATHILHVGHDVYFKRCSHD
jgi:zinc transport system ATP-binding protein